MAPTLAVLAVLALFTRPAMAQDAMPAVLTLEHAVRLALQNNGRIRDALDVIEEARIARRAAQSEFRPKFVPNVMGALGGSDAISNESYRVDLFQRFATGTEFHATVGAASARNQLGTFYYNDTTVSVSQTLLGRNETDGYRRNLDGAERRIDTAVEGHAVAQRRIAIEVAAAYYEIVAQRQVVEVASKSLERARSLQEVSDAKLAIGTVSQLDVLRARQLAREAERQLLDARAVAEDAGDRLRLLTGAALRDLTIDLKIDAAPGVAPAADAVALALERRQDVRAALTALADAERAAAAFRRPPLPRLDLKVAFTRRETADTLRSSFGLGGFKVVPFIAVSMPPDRSAVREAIAIDVERKRRDLQTLQMAVELDVRRAVRHHARLVHSLDSGTAGVEFAVMQLDIAKVRFERGLSSNLELVSAETDLLAAEGRRIGILAALAVARLRLKDTLGTLDLAEDFKQ